MGKGKWWIMVESITTPIIKQLELKSPNNELLQKNIDTLVRDFIKNDLRKIIPERYDSYANFDLESDKLLRALNIRSDGGVFIKSDVDKKLLDLLCYIGFTKNWLETLSSLNIKESDIEKITSEEKNMRVKQGNTKLSIKNENLEPDDETIARMNHNNNEINKAKHADFYIYYYESYIVETKKYQMKFALIGFNLDNQKKEWNGGIVYYLNENFIIHKPFELQVEENENKKILFCRATFEDQINFYTIKTNGKRIQDREILPLTYSVLETQSGHPCAGPAFLERIYANKCTEKIEEIIRNGIRKEFIYALYRRKTVLEDFVFTNSKDFFERNRIL